MNLRRLAYTATPPFRARSSEMISNCCSGARRASDQVTFSTKPASVTLVSCNRENVKSAYDCMTEFNHFC